MAGPVLGVGVECADIRMVLASEGIEFLLSGGGKVTLEFLLSEGSLFM